MLEKPAGVGQIGAGSVGDTQDAKPEKQSPDPACGCVGVQSMVCTVSAVWLSTVMCVYCVSASLGAVCACGMGTQHGV